VPLNLPDEKVVGKTWVIGDVTYRKGDDGTYADLTIMPPTAFYPEPILLQPFQADVPAGTT
jgi:prophage tail gpP-like protein